MKRLILFLTCLFAYQVIFGQYQMDLVPRKSPEKAVYQKIGFTELNVKYGSPALKNRKIWGELVPYDNVWRAGANNATTIKINNTITINNVQLDSGKYSFFVIPRENDKWTVIFNKVHKQWGAFKYNKDEDALRVDIVPRKTKSSTENLTYAIKQFGYQYGSIVLKWGFMEIEVPFETNYLEKFQQEVETRAGSQPDYLKWIVYIQGAEHLEQIGLQTDLGLSWINQAEQIMDSTNEWNKQFYPRDYVKGHLYWTKAKLLAKSENFMEANNYVKKLKSLENTIFYDRKKEVEDIDNLIELWKEK